MITRRIILVLSPQTEKTNQNIIIYNPIFFYQSSCDPPALNFRLLQFTAFEKSWKNPAFAFSRMSSSPELQLEEQDLLPTLHDFGISARWLSNSDSSVSNVLVLLDPQEFLKTYFSQKPPLRLTICALAAKFSQPPLPDHIVARYYKRARKAVIKWAGEASVGTVQACILISSFGLGVYHDNEKRMQRPN
jgi:hypothetical protein